MKSKKIISLLIVQALILTLLMSNTVFAIPGVDNSYSRWAENYIRRANEMNLLTPELKKDFQRDLSREDFTILIVNFYERLMGKPNYKLDKSFKDTNSTWVKKAYELGLVQGVGDNMFMPKDKLTRQEAAVMFYRVIEIYKVENNIWTSREVRNRRNQTEFKNIKGYRDFNDISPWARVSMDYMNEKNIIVGIGNDYIIPRGNIKLEQGIAIVVRTIDLFEKGNKINPEVPRGVKIEDKSDYYRLSWTNSSNIDYYYVYESVNGVDYNLLRDDYGKPLKIKRNYIDLRSLLPGVEYSYKVSSVKDGIESQKSSTVSVKTSEYSKYDMYRDYENHLMNHHNSFNIMGTEIKFYKVEIFEDWTQSERIIVNYYLDDENSNKLRRLIFNNYSGDIRTLYSQVLREVSDFYGKDVKGSIIYEGSNLQNYPSMYEYNRLVSQSIYYNRTTGTYDVWFPYLEIYISKDNSFYNYNWFYREYDL